MFVERPGAFVQGVHEQGAHAGMACHGGRSLNGVLQQGTAKLASLHTTVHGQPRQNHDR